MQGVQVGTTRTDLTAFMSWPLAPLGLATYLLLLWLTIPHNVLISSIYVKTQTAQEDGGEPVSDLLPFDVSAQAHSHVAKEMLERMRRDAKAYLHFYCLHKRIFSYYYQICRTRDYKNYMQAH